MAWREDDGLRPDPRPIPVVDKRDVGQPAATAWTGTLTLRRASGPAEMLTGRAAPGPASGVQRRQDEAQVLHGVGRAVLERDPQRSVLGEEVDAMGLTMIADVALRTSALTELCSSDQAPGW